MEPAANSNPATPLTSSATKNPKVIMIAGLAILVLVMVAVIGIISGIKKAGDPSASSQNLATSTTPAPGAGDNLLGAPPTDNGLTSLPGAGIPGYMPSTNLGSQTSPSQPGAGYGALPGGPVDVLGAPSTPGTGLGALPGNPGSPAFSTPAPSAPLNTLLDERTPATARIPASPSALPGVSSVPPAPAPATLPTPSYTVKENDTLWRIAQTHLGDGSRWKLLVQANPGLTPEKLRTGMKIKLPSASARSAAAGAGATTPRAAATRRTVRVQDGETLYAIARREYGDGEKWDVIYHANKSRIANPNNLPSGMTLQIPIKPAG